MVEITSVREESPKLSAKERLCLIKTINALPPTQFDELVFALNPPKGVISPNNSPQGQRSKELLDWLEGSSGPGLTAADEVLQVLIPHVTKTAPQPLAFVISGKISPSTATELQAFVELLRKKTGDNSIDIAFFEEGSIKVILNGLPEGLAQLQEMVESGEIEQLGVFPVTAVTAVDSNSQDARKARLIQVLRLRGQLLTLKAADSIRDLARYFDLARRLAHYIAHYLDMNGNDRSHIISLTKLLANYIDRAIQLDYIPVLSTQQSAHLSQQSLVMDLAEGNLSAGFYHTITNDLDRFRNNILYMARDISSYASNLDMEKADLRGANLTDINLTGFDLTGADLTYTDVTRTIFGGNPGLTEADKRDLQRRGAIIQDPPSSDVPVMAHR
ncbi:pentapeptide repeat-containing protein [Phormidium sp. FACHB-1136]|uniref:pentapeptide repeat-containing protein n=1 Tax=Phormidium sp. FACHB-1136 TaxID=2692848 RepID=UPI0016823B1C|nr:pentapeptide repeat-containing protein [Phormidium sp. FACHB-1136]MBD2428791.1 pentapeptide repeat-containing protein [Phormidium sp. FACHB-1136]